MKKKLTVQYVESFLDGMIDAVSSEKTAPDGFEYLLNLTPYVSVGDLILRRGAKSYWSESPYMSEDSDYQLHQFKELALETFVGTNYTLIGMAEDPAETSTHDIKIWDRLSDSSSGYNGVRSYLSSRSLMSSASANDVSRSFAFDAYAANEDERYNVILTASGICRAYGIGDGMPYSGSSLFRMLTGQAIAGRTRRDDWFGVSASINRPWATSTLAFIRAPEINDTPDDTSEIFITDIDSYPSTPGTGDYAHYAGISFRLNDGEVTPMSLLDLTSSTTVDDATIMYFSLMVPDGASGSSNNNPGIREWAKSILVWGAKIDTGATSPNNQYPHTANNTDRSILQEFNLLMEIPLGRGEIFASADATYGMHQLNDGGQAFISTTGEDVPSVNVLNTTGTGLSYPVYRGPLYDGRINRSVTASCNQESLVCYASPVYAAEVNSRVFGIGGYQWGAGDVRATSSNGWVRIPKTAVIFSHIDADGVPHRDYFPATNVLFIGSAGDGECVAVVGLGTDLIVLKDQSVYRVFMGEGYVETWAIRKIDDRGIDNMHAQCTTPDSVYYCNTDGIFRLQQHVGEPVLISDKISDQWRTIYDLVNVRGATDSVRMAYNRAKQEVWIVYRSDSGTSRCFVYNEQNEGFYLTDRTPEWIEPSVFGGILSIDSDLGHGVWHEDSELNDHTLDTPVVGYDSGDNVGVSVSGMKLTDTGETHSEATYLNGVLTVYDATSDTDYLITDITGNDITVSETITQTLPTHYKLTPREITQTATAIPFTLKRNIDPGVNERKSRIRNVFFNMQSEEDRESGKTLDVDVKVQRDDTTVEREVLDVSTKRGDNLRVGISAQDFQFIVDSAGATFDEDLGSRGGIAPDSDPDGGMPGGPGYGSTDGNRGFVLKNIGYEMSLGGKV